MSAFDSQEPGAEGAGPLGRLCAGLRTARPERMLVLGIALQLASLIVAGIAAAVISSITSDPATFSGPGAAARFFNKGSVVGMVGSGLSIVGWGLVIFAAARLVADAMKGR